MPTESISQGLERIGLQEGPRKFRLGPSRSENNCLGSRSLLAKTCCETPPSKKAFVHLSSTDILHDSS